MLEKAIELAGGQSELARIINVSQPRIWNWLHRDKKVPAEYVNAIVNATGERVTRHQLRPDIFPDSDAA